MAHDADFTLRSVDRGGRRRIVLAGELDLRRAPQLERAVAQACEAGVELLELDLRAVTFIDSTGVHGILQTVRRCDEHGCALTIVPSPHRSPRRVFKLLHLEDALPWEAHAASGMV